MVDAEGGSVNNHGGGSSKSGGKSDEETEPTTFLGVFYSEFTT